MWWFFPSLTSKCASCHNGVHFFEHLNVQEYSEYEVLLQNVLRTTASFDLSSDQMALYLPLYRAYFSTLRSCKTLEKTVFRDFSTSLHTLLFFLLARSLLGFFFLSLLCLFPPLLLHLSIIFVGSLASKFHSIISSYPSNFQPFKDCRLLRHLWPWPGRPSEASTSSRGGVRRLHQGVFSLFCPVQCWSRHHSLT